MATNDKRRGPTLSSITETLGNVPSDDPQFRAGGPYWREVSGAIYARLRGSIVDTIQQLQEVYGEGWTDYAPRPAGYVSWLARQVATVYTSSPTVRYLDPKTGKVLDADVVASITRYRKDARVEQALLAAHEEMCVCGNGTVWVTPVIREQDGEDGGGQILTVEARSIPAYQQTVSMGLRPSSHDERDVAAWDLQMPAPGGSVAFGSFGVAEITASTAAWKTAPGALSGQPVWPMKDKGGMSNPIGEVPAVVLRWADPRPGDFWAMSREELLWQARAIDRAFTDAGQISNLQGFGQWIGKFLGGAGKIKFGPNVIVDLGSDEKAALTNVSPAPDQGGSLAALEGYLRVAIASQDGNPASLIRSTAITAMGKQMEIADRDSLRRRHLAELARAEQRIYNLMRKWLRALKGVDVLPAAILVVEYPPPIIPVDPLHEVQTNERLLALGQTNPYKIYARSERVTLVEAQRAVDENLAITRKLLVSLPAPGTPPPAAETSPPPGTDVADGAS